MSVVPTVTNLKTDDPLSNQPQNESSAGDQLIGDLDAWVARQKAARQFAETAAKRRFVSEYMRRMNAPRFPAITTAGELLAYVVQQGNAMYERGDLENPFVLDGYRLHVYQQLAAYFSGDYTTFPCTLKPKRGILLVGGYGVGKTLAMRLFANNPVRSYRLVSSRSISEAFRLNGDVCEYKQKIANPCSTKFFGQLDLGLCIGDFGAERSDGKHYGSGFSVGDLLLDRYENNQLRGWTHAETNGSPADLMNAYGPRVNDRLFEMFNVVRFPEDTPSFRI
ncbi:ATP-binding protein [Spirosoma sordidisoli]|uniref:ATPase n=1 Tax=Spirosoma sordidisoli TaxID=2502893 RepID=A0A4Q2UKS0_9BACT|nr:ATP-binding protein [Spirosoma sordidisoli]RYC70093.1 hypothetical protein EQG79_09485 [Spirosoma sordidisoli]